MTEVFAAGGYRFIPAVFQYSAGVAAEPGFCIERVSFRRPIPLAQGFERAAQIIGARGRPLMAFCACELRSPAPFTDAGFRAFNEIYASTLESWGIYDSTTAINPVARSNVCPELSPPAEPCFHAFCFTTLGQATPANFVIAGSGEAREGVGLYRDRTVRWGELGAEAMRDKAIYVLGEMERRLGLLGKGWSDTGAVQVYTVHDLYPFFASEIVARGAARCGLAWHYCRPPVRGLEYEMDCRAVAREHFVD